MTPIIDMQRRLREAGRIRLGQRTENRNGKMVPSSLSEFRFTSSDRKAIEAIAETYGGVVQQWKDAPIGEQWEVYTDTKELEVIVPPVELAFTQWMELWSGGGCVRRCDGQRNVIDDTACVCQPDKQACKPTTRLGVMLTALEGIGVWRLEIHGWNGAQELLGTIEVIRTMQNRGAMVPARLLLEQRQSKTDGKTNNFVVPVLDLQFNMANALGAPGERSYITAIPRIEGAQSAESQILAVSNTERLEAIEARSRSAVLPPTGLLPRTADGVGVRVTQEQGENASPSKIAVSPAIRKISALMNGCLGIPADETGRVLWAMTVIGREIKSLGDLTPEETEKITQKVKSLAATKQQDAVQAAIPQHQPNEEPF
jgi:hypothetical protein